MLSQILSSLALIGHLHGDSTKESLESARREVNRILRQLRFLRDTDPDPVSKGTPTAPPDVAPAVAEIVEALQEKLAAALSAKAKAAQDHAGMLTELGDEVRFFKCFGVDSARIESKFDHLIHSHLLRLIGLVLRI